MKRSRKTCFVLKGIIGCFLLLVSSTEAQQAPIRMEDPRQKLFLAMEEAIGLALQNNLEISVQQFTPEIRKEEITTAEAAFDSDTTAQAAQTFNEATSVTSPTGITTFEANVGKRFKTGTSYELGLDVNVATFDGTTTTMVIDPETGLLVPREVGLDNDYDANFGLTVRQPLLRNLGTDVNTTQISITSRNRDISVSQLRATVIDVVSRVKNTYWDLVNALADLDSARISLQLAYNLVKINEAQVSVGTLAPIEILQAKAQAASREVDVTTAELAVQNVEDQLRRLLNFQENDPIWQAAIVPTDAPTEQEQPITLEESLQVALQNREELKQLQKSIEIQELSLNFSENQLLPELNLLGNVGISGKDKTFGDALTGFASYDNYGVTVGANFSYPLGNRAAQSTYNRTRLELDQTRLSGRDLEQLISVEVRIVVRRLKTAFNLIGATRIARQLSEEQLDAEQKKFNEGLSTNFQVLDFQDKLTTARTREALAITAYNQALVDFEQATGITLQRHGIVIKE